MKLNRQQSYRFRRKPRKGFMLMDVLLAILVFTLFITGVGFAINNTAKLQQVIQQRSWVDRQKQNIVVELLRTPSTEQDFLKSKQMNLASFGATAQINVRPIEVFNQEGDLLENMYDIIVDLRWDQDGSRQSEQFTLRTQYGLYN